MIATFLKTVDGDFDTRAVCVSLMLMALVFLYLWMLYGALRRGRIPYGAGYRGSRIFYAEREKQPAGFWFVFVLVCLMMAFLPFYDLCLVFWVVTKASLIYEVSA